MLDGDSSVLPVGLPDYWPRQFGDLTSHSRIRLSTSAFARSFSPSCWRYQHVLPRMVFMGTLCQI
jgi:hypothetical protein